MALLVVVDGVNGEISGDPSGISPMDPSLKNNAWDGLRDLIRDVRDVILNEIEELPKMIFNFFIESLLKIILVPLELIERMVTESVRLHEDFVSNLLGVDDPAGPMMATVRVIVGFMYLLYQLIMIRFLVLILDVVPLI